MARKQRRRDPVKERFWRRVVRRRQRSGLTVREFCRDEGVAESSYHYWRRELARRDREQTSGEEGAGVKGISPEGSAASLGGSKEAPAFVLVQVVPDDAESFPSRQIEVVLTSGETVRVPVRVPVGFDSRVLEGVLRVLEGRPC